MNSYSSREVIALLKKDGWYKIKSNGDHHHFKHPFKKGRVTVPHPRKDLSPAVLKSISKQSGIHFK